MSRHTQHADLLRTYYARCLALHGVDPAGVDWSDLTVQQARFAALLLLLPAAPMHGATLLDVGCGFGDLLSFMTHRRPYLVYTGCDLSVPHLAEARRRHPTATFLEGDAIDILDAACRAGRRWDYVVASGTFNVRVPHWPRWAWALLQAMWSVTAQGLAFNLLTMDVRTPPAVVAVKPSVWLARCRTLSPHAFQRTDYLPGDVTFYLPR